MFNNILSFCSISHLGHRIFCLTQGCVNFYTVKKLEDLSPMRDSILLDSFSMHANFIGYN